MNAISENTPVAMMTLGQLKVALQPLFQSEQESFNPSKVEAKRYVYGLRGIRTLFNVSHATAQRYKDTILAPAVKQNGKKIIIDADMAIELFNQDSRG